MKFRSIGKMKVLSEIKTRLKAFFDPNKFNFIILVPLAAGAMSGDEKAMTREQILQSFPGNTVVVESEKGTAYAYVHKDGKANGLHPTAGKIEGKWRIDGKGVVCVTWPLPNDTIKNCDKTVDLGDGKYKWANKDMRVQNGDPKKLAD